MLVYDRIMLRRLAHFRFGLGPAPSLRPSEADPRVAVLAEVGQPVPQPPGDLPSGEQGVGLYVARQRAIREARQRKTRAQFVSPTQVSDRELFARMDLARTTRTPLHERLALHWANHFTIGGQNYSSYFAGAMEREAIRPNMFGRFGDMLRGCTVHPAMLFYLGNRSSIGPLSEIGRRRGLGLNENLGRELLELHTLGVDGGYTQEDVQEVARILTGWTLVTDGTDGPVRRAGFRADMHEPGARRVLGKRYPEGGAEQLEALLYDLARHPATARHVTRRLVQHFVGEAAPPELAAGLAKVFQDTEGDLGAVTRALVSNPAAWSVPPSKVRPPIELLMSAGRVFGGLPPRPALRRTLLVMGQPYGRAPSPAGWPEEDDAWATPEAIKTRLDWALVAAGQLDASHDARAIAELAFGDGLSEDTRRALQRAESGRQALALLLMSPEFQRR